VRFEDVPHPSDAVVRSSVQDGVQRTLEMEIPDASAEAVVDYYDEVLTEEGWRVENEPVQTRDGILTTYERKGRLISLLVDEREATDDEPQAATIRFDFYDLPRA
jgi:hypothetical protein